MFSECRWHFGFVFQIPEGFSFLAKDFPWKTQGFSSIDSHRKPQEFGSESSVGMKTGQGISVRGPFFRLLRL
jgi:hypothetical protein